MIKDLFSHKIHSSSENWPERLIEITSIFSLFDGMPYDRKALENKFREISLRNSDVARDPSKFRDEISAYASYLGVYRVELVNNIWHLFLSDTAKKYLLCESPNVKAFVLLQMLLFQYPNGMGIVYLEKNKSRIQINAADRTLNIIKNKIYISPLRLIIKMIIAKADLHKNSIFNIRINFSEVFALANHKKINQYINPDIDLIKEALINYNQNKIFPPDNFEKRFHILNHTSLLKTHNGVIELEQPINEKDRSTKEEKIKILSNLDNYFSKFDSINNHQDLLNSINKSEWHKYFDAVNTLNENLIEKILKTDEFNLITTIQERTNNDFLFLKNNEIYPFRKPIHNREVNNKKTQGIYADAEITNIKRERANLQHRIILEKLHNYLLALNANILENEHIDLYAILPNNLKIIFEVKSTNEENLLTQVRKGISQLYEYSYRYKDIIGHDIYLCLVFQEEPTSINWLQDYICLDRKIAVLWFEGNSLHYSSCGKELFKLLFDAMNL